jgi:hypothetical protein
MLSDFFLYLKFVCHIHVPGIVHKTYVALRLACLKCREENSLTNNLRRIPSAGILLRQSRKSLKLEPQLTSGGKSSEGCRFVVIVVVVVFVVAVVYVLLFLC